MWRVIQLFILDLGNSQNTELKRSHSSRGGYSPILTDRDVPPVRPGFSAKNPLKAGMKFPRKTVKPGSQVKNEQKCVILYCKTGFSARIKPGFAQKNPVKPGLSKIFQRHIPINPERH